MIKQRIITNTMARKQGKFPRLMKSDFLIPAQLKSRTARTRSFHKLQPRNLELDLMHNVRIPKIRLFPGKTEENAGKEDIPAKGKNDVISARHSVKQT